MRDQRPALRTPPVLTKRERAIAALVAEGWSNQAIADRLGVTRATVSSQIAQLVWRLGLTSRLAISAWVIEQARRAPGGPANSASGASQATGDSKRPGDRPSTVGGSDA